MKYLLAVLSLVVLLICGMFNPTVVLTFVWCGLVGVASTAVLKFILS